MLLEEIESNFIFIVALEESSSTNAAAKPKVYHAINRDYICNPISLLGRRSNVFGGNVLRKDVASLFFG